MFDIHSFLKELAIKRPIFHSEADFQHSFAWQLHQKYPEMSIRLEYPHFIERQMYLDIWAQSSEFNLAIELKYKTKTFEIPSGDERFLLKNHGAHDLGRYDFLKDIERLETIIKHSTKPILGYAVLLTNDAGYLAEEKKNTIDKAFRLYKDRTFTGKLDWQGTVRGTAKHRPNPINIGGTYTVTWNTYSTFNLPKSEFQYLAIQCS